jgi:O-antigen ligase
MRDSLHLANGAGLAAAWRGGGRHALFDRVIGGVLGTALPALVLSEVACGVILALGLLLLLLAPGRAALLQMLALRLKSPLGLAAAGLLASWLPAVALSLEPMRSLSVWGNCLGLLIGAGLIACLLARSAAAHELCLKALIIAALVCGALALIACHGGSAFYGPFRGRAFEAFDAALYIKYYASAVACLAPAVLHAGFALKGAWRGAALCYLPMALAVILTLSSGAALLGLGSAAVVGAIALAGGLPRLNRPALALLGVLVAAGLAGLGLLFAHAPAPPPLEALAGRRYDGPLETPLPLYLVDAHRQQIWGLALGAFGNAPWFGHGLDLSNYIPGAHTIIARFNQAFVPAHPHDWIIELLVDAGCVGLAGMIGALAVLIARWLGLLAIDRPRAAAGLALGAAFFSSSLLNFSFWSAWWQAEFLLLTALLLTPRPSCASAAATAR